MLILVTAYARYCSFLQFTKEKGRKEERVGGKKKERKGKKKKRTPKFRDVEKLDQGNVV